MRKVAIVGSEGKYWTTEQRKKVTQEIIGILKIEADKYALNSTPPFYPYQPSYMSDKYWVGVITLISGGCPKGGVDIWAEIVADTLRIKKKIYKPEVYRWDDITYYDDSRINPPEVQKGYRSRNIEIAKTCDVLYCIDAKGRKRSGGRWTLEYAKKLGKETHLIEI